jgi:hypothetical protein
MEWDRGAHIVETERRLQRLLLPVDPAVPEIPFT